MASKQLWSQFSPFRHNDTDVRKRKWVLLRCGNSTVSRVSRLHCDDAGPVTSRRAVHICAPYEYHLTSGGLAAFDILDSSATRWSWLIRSRKRRERSNCQEQQTGTITLGTEAAVRTVRSRLVDACASPVHVVSPAKRSFRVQDVTSSRLRTFRSRLPLRRLNEPKTSEPASALDVLGCVGKRGSRCKATSRSCTMPYLVRKQHPARTVGSQVVQPNWRQWHLSGRSDAVEGRTPR